VARSEAMITTSSKDVYPAIVCPKFMSNRDGRFYAGWARVCDPSGHMMPFLPVIRLGPLPKSYGCGTLVPIGDSHSYG
jgi:hypothetical protein